MPFDYTTEAGRERAKAARRKHYHNNKQQYYRRNQERQNEMKDYVASVKDVPCQDCGNRYPPYCMDLHHRDMSDKSDAVGNMIKRSSSWPKLLAEIAKCDIVCAICHRIRHHRGEAEVAG